MAGGLRIEGTPQQIELLTDIVTGWANEGFTTPPYQSEVYDIFEALGIPARGQWYVYDTERPMK